MPRRPRDANTLYFALPSVEMTSATRRTSPLSNVAASAIDCGNTVASPARATPCSASFHQWYGFIPRRSIAGESIIS